MTEVFKNKLPYSIEDLDKWSKFLGHKDFDDYVKNSIDKNNERGFTSWWPLSEIAHSCKVDYDLQHMLMESLWHKD